MTVTHELPRLRTRCRQAEPIGDVIEAPFEQLQQRFAGDPPLPLGRFEVAPELIFQHAVNALDLLLLAQLHAVTDELRFARLAMLTGREVPLLDRALLRVAPLPFQEELHAFSPAQPAHRTYISRHSVNLFLFAWGPTPTRCRRLRSGS